MFRVTFPLVLQSERAVTTFEPPHTNKLINGPNKDLKWLGKEKGGDFGEFEPSSVFLGIIANPVYNYTKTKVRGSCYIRALCLDKFGNINPVVCIKLARNFWNVAQENTMTARRFGKRRLNEVIMKSGSNKARTFIDLSPQPVDYLFCYEPLYTGITSEWQKHKSN